MKLVHSKDIYYIMRDTLKSSDPRVMNHGERVAYLLYCMLRDSGKYEMYELAEFAMIATMHDIGVYRTNYMEDPINYELREPRGHSIYGYLYLLNLTPFKDRAKLLLYHHTDFNKSPKSGFDYLDVAHFLRLAEDVDFNMRLQGEKFDPTSLNQFAGTKYSQRALVLFNIAVRKYDVINKIKSGEYRKELDDLLEYLIFSNEEKQDILVGMMHFISFRSEYTLFDVVTCVQICGQMAQKMNLSREDTETLMCAAVLHDIGMCAVPRELIETKEELTPEQQKTFRYHVKVSEDILKGRVRDEVLETILAHHERCDGTGYPNHLKDSQMTPVQNILQLADKVTGLVNDRSYAPCKNRDEVFQILQDEVTAGHINRAITKVFLSNYDEIMVTVKAESEKMLSMYRKLKTNFEGIYVNQQQ